MMQMWDSQQQSCGRSVVVLLFALLALGPTAHGQLSSQHHWFPEASANLTKFRFGLLDSIAQTPSFLGPW